MKYNDRFYTYYVLEDRESMPYKEFVQDDIVTITFNKTENNVTDECTETGRINWIDTSYIEIDCSCDYKTNVIQVSFDDILEIN